MTTRASKVFEKEIKELTFGSMIRAFRTMNDKKQEEVAGMLSISKQNLCDIEKGRQLVSASRAKEIAKILGMSEKLAIELCLQDQLKKAKVSYKVELKKHA